MIDAVEELKRETSMVAGRILSVLRSSIYRARKPKPRPTPAQALMPEEKAKVRAILNSERFCDSSAGYVQAVG